MAKIVSQQKSLNVQAKYYLILGVIGVIGGLLSGFVLSGIAVLMVPVVLITVGGGFLSKGLAFLKGAIGESKVTAILNQLPDDWYIFNDLKVNGAQIDHIIVGPGGIYTVETKNYYGQIYGNSENKEWSQVYKDDKGYFRKRPFYNPVKQGIVHSIALNKFISEKKAGDFFIKTIVVGYKPKSPFPQNTGNSYS